MMRAFWSAGMVESACTAASHETNWTLETFASSPFEDAATR
jgi:hypothetical protein